ncbi:MAG TPA: lamin tail domain-containing protein [Caldilinea sp.]|mgnify:CR=1 FL=1|nr:lamin tail domain-containing protein [Caldilinea sp.]
MRCLFLVGFRSIPKVLWTSLWRYLIVIGWILLAGGVFWLAPQPDVRAQGALCTICISQVYGGGGNDGATYDADFIELFNATDASLSLDNWSVEYAPATSANWKSIALDGRIMPPYTYLLIIGMTPGSEGLPLPSPDLTGDLDIAVDQGNVKLRAPDSLPETHVDLLGYGAVDASENQPAPAGSSNDALHRLLGGCTDSNNNSADFESSEPTPRNSGSPSNPCAPPTPTPEPPSPTPTDTEIPTPTETPSPTTTSTPEPLPTEPPSPTPTDTETPTFTPTATPSPTATATNTPESPPIATPSSLLIEGPAVASDVRLSEIMAAPSIDDAVGEFIEIANADIVRVNLQGWRLVDKRNRSHVIATELWIEPGAYLVLTRGAVDKLAGYVHSDYQFSSLQLVNTDGKLSLFAPNSAVDAQPVDEFTWDKASPGASFERTDLLDNNWVVATTPWSATHIDKGSPGAAFVAPPTPTPTPTSGPAPLLRLSEIMAAPSIDDAVGEFIEIANVDAVRVNLQGWRLVDGGNHSHVIATDLWIEPGAYRVLTKGDAVALADYIHSDYQFSLLQLANTDGALSLFAPGNTADAQPVDAFAWGGAGLRVQTGASFERTDLTGTNWVIATTLWSATHTDKGSPGAAFVAPATPTPTPTPGPAPLLRLSEIMANPQAINDDLGEFIEIANVDAVRVNLQGWRLVDGGNHSHVIATDLWIEPGAYRVLTKGDAVALADYIHSDYQFSLLQLANTNGALSLFAPNSAADAQAVDTFAWGSANLRVEAGASFERTDLFGNNWVVAATPWSAAHADKGSPGAAFAGIILPTATPTPVVFPTPTPTPGPALRIRLSEIMADPQAVEDAIGEFIELGNADAAPVNLRGWRLADGGGRTHVIDADVWIAPGAYLVLTRGDAATLGSYVHSDYRYAALQLGNTTGAVSLYAPDSAPADPPVDSVVWGDGLRIRTGASLERVDLAASAWVVATSAWTATHSDKGSPGAAFAGGISPTPTFTPSATRIPLPTLTPTPLPERWLRHSQASVLQIDEVHFQGSDGEFIALINLGNDSVSLRGWMVGDAETPGDNEGIVCLPEDAILASGEIYVVARNAAAFRQVYGRQPDAEWEANDDSVPDLLREPRLGSGRLALDDGGDEVVLLDPSGLLTDAVAYKTAAYATLALEGQLTPPTGLSLQRVPDADFAGVRDVRHRFLAASPRPFERRGLPLPAWREPVKLDVGFQAAWGSLGGASNFTPGFTAPPHYLLAEAAAQGLDFLAIADQTPTQPVRALDGITSLAAWRWREGDDELIIYDNIPPADLSRAGVMAHLAGAGLLWQNAGELENFHHAPLLPAGGSAPPSSLADWFAAWQSNLVPALPAGNGNPDLPGFPQLQPRYTGLAVVSSDATGIQEALHARRGWVATSPGLWLTMQAERSDGQRVWMGQWLPPANQVTLHIGYGDRSGEMAGLAIWQDGRPLHQLDLPTADGRWRVTLPAVPGAILTVVATQFDGDFAVAAPFFIESGETGALVLNEVLPAPRNDYSGDGIVDGQDEYIELYNPGQLPFPLTGWTLQDGDDDAASHHMTFGAGRFLGGGERLLLLHKANRLSLRNDAGVVLLLDPHGVERDRITWDDDLTHGRSIARVPDGGAWVWSADATPGTANTNTGVNNFAPWPSAPPPGPSNNAPLPNPAVEATAGQIGGPPGSIAQSKLSGLGAWVEFRAVVVAPPGLFNSSIYVADVTDDSVTAGIGLNVYLRRGEYPTLEAGDLVLLRGRLDSFRGETELILDTPDQIWRIAGGGILQPLVTRPRAIGESLEGRLVTFRGVVTGWQGDSIFLSDPDDPDAEPVRVTIRTTLPWKRPYVKLGEFWQATGMVSQFAREAPWNGGYRILVRWQQDLVRAGQ